MKAQEQKPDTKETDTNKTRSRVAAWAGRTVARAQERADRGADAMVAGRPGSREGLHRAVGAIHRSESKHGVVTPDAPYKGSVYAHLARTPKDAKGVYNAISHVIVTGESAFAIVSRNREDGNTHTTEAVYGVMMPLGMNFLRASNTISKGRRRIFANIPMPSARKINEFRLGRSLSQDDDSMSSTHANVGIDQQGSVIITDLDTTNGTQVIDAQNITGQDMSPRDRKTMIKFHETLTYATDFWDPSAPVEDPLSNGEEV
jgi:hypothetical protein